MARKKLPPKKLVIPKPKKPKTWVVCGFDISQSVLAGAGIGWDGVLNRMVGPVFCEQRFPKGTDYLERLRHAARPEVLVHELIAKLLMTPELDEIYISMEEPWPFGMAKRAQSMWLKQQAQITGAFLAGLARYGYVNIHEINNSAWKTPIGKEIGMSTRDKKFKTEGMKTWALQAYSGVPDWPHLISSNKLGLIPKPETSKAKPVQADDRYDALGIMAYEQSEIEEDL